MNDSLLRRTPYVLRFSALCAIASAGTGCNADRQGIDAMTTFHTAQNNHEDVGSLDAGLPRDYAANEPRHNARHTVTAHHDISR